MRLAMRTGKTSKTEANFLFLRAVKMILDSKIKGKSDQKDALYTRIDIVSKNYLLQSLYEIKDTKEIPAKVEEWLERETIEKVYTKLTKMADLAQEPLEDVYGHCFSHLIRKGRFDDLVQCLNSLLLSGLSCEGILETVEKELLRSLDDNPEALIPPLVKAMSAASSISVAGTENLTGSLILKSSWLHHISRLQCVHEPDEHEKSRLTKHQFKVRVNFPSFFFENFFAKMFLLSIRIKVSHWKHRLPNFRSRLLKNWRNCCILSPKIKHTLRTKWS